MTGIPARREVERLAAFSREQAAAGPPPATDKTVVIDERGYAFGLSPDGPESGAFVHAGLRLAWVPMPLQGGLLLSLWGGLEAEAGFEEEGVTAFITAAGLRRLADDLAAIAGSIEP